MKLIIFTLLFFTAINHTYADSCHESSTKNVTHSHELVSEAHQKISVSVHGLVCDFCARSLEKVLLKKSGIHDVNVSIASGSIVIATDSGYALTSEQLTKEINDAGYHVNAIHYEK